jgi:hypothetical protein
MSEEKTLSFGKHKLEPIVSGGSCFGEQLVKLLQILLNHFQPALQGAESSMVHDQRGDGCERGAASSNKGHKDGIAHCHSQSFFDPDLDLSNTRHALKALTFVKSLAPSSSRDGEKTLTFDPFRAERHAVYKRYVSTWYPIEGRGGTFGQIRPINARMHVSLTEPY